LTLAGDFEMASKEAPKKKHPSPALKEMYENED
jgi:hypothetical protein